MKIFEDSDGTGIVKRVAIRVEFHVGRRTLASLLYLWEPYDVFTGVEFESITRKSLTDKLREELYFHGRDRIDRQIIPAEVESVYYNKIDELFPELQED